MARVRFESIFSRNPFRNVSLNFGVVLALTLMVIIVWVPGVRDFFQSKPPPAVALVPCLFFGLYAWIVTEVIKYYRRKDRNACKLFSW